MAAEILAPKPGQTLVMAHAGAYNRLMITTLILSYMAARDRATSLNPSIRMGTPLSRNGVAERASMALETR